MKAGNKLKFCRVSLEDAISKRREVEEFVSMFVTNTGLLGLGCAALAHTGLSFVPSGPASSSFLL